MAQLGPALGKVVPEGDEPGKPLRNNAIFRTARNNPQPVIKDPSRLNGTNIAPSQRTLYIENSDEDTMRTQHEFAKNRIGIPAPFHRTGWLGGSVSTAGSGGAVVDATTSTGSDACQKIMNSFASSTYVTVDARGFTGVQDCGGTLAVPNGATLWTGNVQFVFNQTTGPVVTLGNNVRWYGGGQNNNNFVTPPRGTQIVANVTNSSVLQAANQKGTAYWKLDSIFIDNTSQSNAGSIDFDLTGVLFATVTNTQAARAAVGYHVGGTSACACYNTFIDNDADLVGIGVDFEANFDSNIWMGGQIQPYGSGGTGIKINQSVAVELIKPDIENFTGGTGIVITASNAIAIRSPYLEVGATGISIDANSKVLLENVAMAAVSPTLYSIKSSNPCNVIILDSNSEYDAQPSPCLQAYEFMVPNVGYWGNDGYGNMELMDPKGGNTKTLRINALVAKGLIGQGSPNQWAGACAMQSGTTCEFDISSTFTKAICVVSPQGTTALAGACSLTGQTVKVTATAPNSLTWGAVLIGDPY